MPAKLIRTFYNLKDLDGCVITLGNFDGVHLGHQALLKRLLAVSKERQRPHLVITFEPHPFEFFDHNKQGIPRLTRLREKFQALRAYGVENILVLKFNQQLASLSASDFVSLLHTHLKPNSFVLGDDFHFGHKRMGDVNFLKEAGKQLNFTVESMPTFNLLAHRVSSTRIRKALAEGDQKLAETLLGRPFSMLGRVCHGDKQGRVWGFPTANIFLHRHLTPVQGVYTVLMRGLSEKPLPGVANVGTRPTVGGTRSLLEVHLLNFNQDIYGRYVEVEFCKKLREEERYNSIELLKDQIAQDVLDAIDYFKNDGVK